jgi:hypothetical protein
MATNLQTENILTPELRFEFSRLGEAVVIHRLTKFESRAIREAAFAWLREQQEARERSHHQRRQSERVSERRWMLIAATVIGCVHIMAGIAIAWN